MPETTTAAILAEIAAERVRQDAQWGGAAHDDAHSAVEWERFRQTFEDRAAHPHLRRDSLVKIAALAVAQIESLDRAAAPETDHAN